MIRKLYKIANQFIKSSSSNIFPGDYVIFRNPNDPNPEWKKGEVLDFDSSEYFVFDEFGNKQWVKDDGDWIKLRNKTKEKFFRGQIVQFGPDKNQIGLVIKQNGPITFIDSADDGMKKVPTKDLQLKGNLKDLISEELI